RQDAGERLDGHDDVRGEVGRRDAAVADGGEGVDAEEERLDEAQRHGLAVKRAERVGAASDVEQREEGVGGDVVDDDPSEELRPGEGEKVVVRGERLPETQPLAPHVERAVAIEEALPALARDDRAESEIGIRIDAHSTLLRASGRRATSRTRSPGSREKTAASSRTTESVGTFSPRSRNPR